MGEIKNNNKINNKLKLMIKLEIGMKYISILFLLKFCNLIHHIYNAFSVLAIFPNEM